MADNLMDYLPLKIIFIMLQLFKLPTDQLISAVLAGFCFQKQASFRLFLLIIFSFQNFRYHSGITDRYQCTYWYYDSDCRNVQELFHISVHIILIHFLIKINIIRYQFRVLIIKISANSFK